MSRAEGGTLSERMTRALLQQQANPTLHSKPHTHTSTGEVSANVDCGAAAFFVFSPKCLLQQSNVNNKHMAK